MEEHNVDLWMGIIFPYINFALFLGAGFFFFRGMAMKAARKKREDFEKAMHDARAAHEAAVSRLDELKRREQGLTRELAEIETTSRTAAEAEAAKIVADAERLAEHLREEARRIAQAEVEKARLTLRREIVDAVKEGVTRKLKDEMNPESQLRLVKKQIGDLRNIHARG